MTVSELVMIDENLIRHELSPAERAHHVAKRKTLYELLHPETANGSNQHSSLRKNCEPSVPRFTKATADLTGQSERSVQLEAARGERLADVIPRIKGTSLDAPGPLVGPNRNIGGRPTCQHVQHNAPLLIPRFGVHDGRCGVEPGV